MFFWFITVCVTFRRKMIDRSSFSGRHDFSLSLIDSREEEKSLLVLSISVIFRERVLFCLFVSSWLDICILITRHHYDPSARQTRETINPFPVRAFVPLVKIAPKNSLSEKICWPAVFVSKPLLHFGVHEKWKLKPEVIWHPKDMQEPLCEAHHLTSKWQWMG